MITILYFARLRESLGRSSEQIALPAGVGDVRSLRAWLALRGESWTEEMAESRQIRAAVNQQVASGEVRIKDGDEIALFPPVTGG